MTTASKRQHWVARNLVAEALRNVIVNGYFISLKPDITVFHGSPRDYADANIPMIPELVIEVAGSSVEYDRRQKAPVYARAGIQEYWLINLEAETVEVRRDPDRQHGVYLSEHQAVRSIVLSLLGVLGMQIAVDALLP